MRNRKMPRFAMNVVLAVMLLLMLTVGGLRAYAGGQKAQDARLTDPGDLLKRIRAQAEDYVDERERAALVIGVIQNGERRVLGFGSVEAEAERRPDAATLYEVGSVTKVFTALLLATLKEEGAVGLDDPITAFLPEEVEVPESVGGITLKQLATHTSGLPRLPSNLDLTGEASKDPYQAYSVSDLYEYLATAGLERDSGKKSVYSNLGYGVLGHLLELSQGVSYEQMVKEQICVPLGMTGTVFEVSETARAKLVPGHNPNGEPVGNWHFDVMSPAGALRSNAADLLTFVAANLNPKGAPLTAALELAQATQFDGLGGRLGLGWHILETEEDREIWWHNGGTGGYVSFVGFDPKHQSGVVLLSNYGDAMRGNHDLDRMGLEILKWASKVGKEPARD